MYSLSRVEEVFYPHLNLADSSDRYKAVGISYEGLVFSPDGGDVDRTLIAKRLHQLFGNAKIIITVRNQFSFIRSLYNELVKHVGCYLSFNQFLEAHYWRFYTYLFHQIFYYDLYRYYADLFGKGEVKVFLFEDLVSDLSQTVNEMCSFLEISPYEVDKVHANPSLSAFSLWMMRIINRIFKNNFGRSYFMPLVPGVMTPGMAKELNWAPDGIERREAWRRFVKRNFRRLDRKFDFRTADITFSEEWRQRIITLYRENNQKLMEETGLDLRKYNYPL